MNTGIYCIRNKRDGKRYIGSAALGKKHSVETRQQMSRVRKGKEANTLKRSQ